jgi:hypothetical protein
MGSTGLVPGPLAARVDRAGAKVSIFAQKASVDAVGAKPTSPGVPCGEQFVLTPPEPSRLFGTEITPGVSTRPGTEKANCLPLEKGCAC